MKQVHRSYRVYMQVIMSRNQEDDIFTDSLDWRALANGRTQKSKYLVSGQKFHVSEQLEESL